MKKSLSRMNTNELRDLAVELGADRKLTGDGTEELQILVSKEVVFCRGGQKL